MSSRLPTLPRNVLSAIYAKAAPKTRAKMTMLNRSTWRDPLMPRVVRSYARGTGTHQKLFNSLEKQLYHRASQAGDIYTGAGTLAFGYYTLGRFVAAAKVEYMRVVKAGMPRMQPFSKRLTEARFWAHPDKFTDNTTPYVVFEIDHMKRPERYTPEQFMDAVLVAAHKVMILYDERYKMNRSRPGARLVAKNMRMENLEYEREVMDRQKQRTQQARIARRQAAREAARRVAEALRP